MPEEGTELAPTTTRVEPSLIPQEEMLAPEDLRTAPLEISLSWVGGMPI